MMFVRLTLFWLNCLVMRRVLGAAMVVRVTYIRGADYLDRVFAGDRVEWKSAYRVLQLCLLLLCRPVARHYYLTWNVLRGLRLCGKVRGWVGLGRVNFLILSFRFVKLLRRFVVGSGLYSRVTSNYSVPTGKDF